MKIYLDTCSIHRPLDSRSQITKVTRDALNILYQQIGIVNTISFIKQFTPGLGNYTAERQFLFADLTLDDALTAIKKRRT